MPKYTMRDVAKEAGVSIATVSRVINGQGNVNEENIKRVNDAISKMNYNVNVIAKNLKEEKTNTIGIIIPDISNPYFMKIAKGLEDTIEKYGFQLIFGSSNEDTIKEKQLINLFYGKRVDAILLATAGNNDSIIHHIRKQGIPIILLDRRLEDSSNYCMIEEDNEYGAYTLTKKLIDLGHQDIGVVNGPLHVSTGIDRYNGFLAAMKEAGIAGKKYL